MGNESARICQLGRRLSLLAATGQAALLLWIAISLAFTVAHFRDSPLELGAPYNALPFLAQLATYAVYMWVLQKLHRIGVALRHGPPISSGLADALRALGHSVLWCTLLVLLLEIPTGDMVGGVPLLTYRFDLDWSAAYLGAIATISTFALARVITEAVRLREDSEAIV